MATGGEEQVGYSLANVGTLTLQKTTNKTPDYNSIVICQDKIAILDTNKVKIHRLHDGILLDMFDSDSTPRDICLMDATTICVLHLDGLIEMASIKSKDMAPTFSKMRRFRLCGALDFYHRVVRIKDNLVVFGVKQDTMYWCIVSLNDGHVDTVHQICKESRSSSVTTKDNIIYISCHADVDDTGVYGFDILNPSKCKYKYKHQRLQIPTSIVINEDGNIFVGNGRHDDVCIHQLTAFCKLVAILTQGIPRLLQAMFWDHGRLYVTCFGSRDVIVFQLVYQGSHKASEGLVSDERKLPGIKEAAIQIAQGNPIKQSVEETFNQAGIKMSIEELDLFTNFQNEIGTDIYFSEGAHRLIDDQESIKATETFFEKRRPDMMDKWLEYKNQGKLTPELIDVIYSKERNPELHDMKDEILGHMEDLNIIVKARSFDENGVKIHDPDSPLKCEHMNHARLCIAIVTVCGKALRELLIDNVPVPYIDIYQAILANHAKLIGGQGRPLLNKEQINLVFPDPLGQKTGTVETFDLSLLYTLIRNVSTVQAPITGWGMDPLPWDTSLGASVERIRSYRNHISGHSPDAKINHQDFKDYWKKFEDVLHDIEVVIKRKVYSKELKRQKRQVISIFDAS